MSSSGNPGDYVIQGAILTAFNQHVVVVLQLALSFVAILCVFKLTNLLTGSVRMATVASMVYLLLPGSLIQPHHLVSEALFNPLVAIASYLLIVSVEKRTYGKTFIFGLLALSVAIFVRPQLMLFPFVLHHTWRDIRSWTDSCRNVFGG